MPDAREPIPDTALYRQMRQGHLARTGHELCGFMLPVVDGIGGGIVRQCCPNTTIRINAQRVLRAEGNVWRYGIDNITTGEVVAGASEPYVVEYFDAFGMAASVAYNAMREARGVADAERTQLAHPDDCNCPEHRCDACGYNARTGCNC